MKGMQRAQGVTLLLLIVHYVYYRSVRRRSGVNLDVPDAVCAAEAFRTRAQGNKSRFTNHHQLACYNPYRSLNSVSCGDPLEFLRLSVQEAFGNGAIGWKVRLILRPET